jgi:uncharacterized protein (TIGR00369 family)
MQPGIPDPQDLGEAAQERFRRSFSNQASMSTLGAELTTVGPGVVEIRLPFTAKFTQQSGYLHAGAAIAVLDSAGGYAALSLAQKRQGCTHRGVEGESVSARFGRGADRQSANPETLVACR